MFEIILLQFWKDADLLVVKSIYIALSQEYLLLTGSHEANPD